MPKFKDYPEFTPNLTPKQIFALVVLLIGVVIGGILIPVFWVKD